MKVMYLTHEYDEEGLSRTHSQDLVKGMVDRGMYVTIVSSPKTDEPLQVLHGGHVTLRRENVERAFLGGIRGLLYRRSGVNTIKKIASLDVGVDMIVVDGYGYHDKTYKALKDCTKALIVCDLISSPILKGDFSKPLSEQYAILKDKQIWCYCDKVIVGSEVERETLLRVGVATDKVEVIAPWRERRNPNEHLALGGKIDRGANIDYAPKKENHASVDKYISILTTMYIKNKEVIC